MIFGIRIRKKEILQAIARAEAGTTGEIRVHLAYDQLAKPEKSESTDGIDSASQGLIDFAREQFHALDMHQTENRNGILFYINPKLRKFAIYGDEGIHQKVGQEFWSRLALEVSEHIRKEDLTEGIIHAIHAMGLALQEHFPADGKNPNELSDDITHD
jgi:uncharacterized membrane protein